MTQRKIKILVALPEIGRGQFVDFIDRKIDGPVLVLDWRTFIDETNTVTVSPLIIVTEGNPRMPGVIPLTIRCPNLSERGYLVLFAKL